MVYQDSQAQDKIWYAVYTRSRNEKKVFLELNKSGIEAYLPLRKTLKQWTDRKKWVEEPLFRSYVFVKIKEKEYLNVLQVNGAVRFICFSGHAAPIPEWQIVSLKLLLDTGSDYIVNTGHLKPGEPVEIVTGALAGFKGEILTIKGDKKIVLRISHLGFNLEVNTVAGVVRPLNSGELTVKC